MRNSNQILEYLKVELKRLNFNINEKVLMAIFKLCTERAGIIVFDKEKIDQFINDISSDETIFQLQAEADEENDEESDETWKVARRNSVYSEVVRPENFQLPYYQKDDETIKFLLGILQHGIPFEFLNPDQKMKLINSMEPRTIKAGEYVIKEGGYENQMYIIDSGEFEVVRGGTVLRRLIKGSYFGEIALLHNIPRTASVKAIVDGKTWVVEQTSFTGIKMIDRICNKKIILEGLKEQNIFPNATDKDYEQISDVQSFVYYKAGTNVNVKDREFFMLLYDGEIDMNGIKSVKSKEVLRNNFVSITDIQGAHIYNIHRKCKSKFFLDSKK